jgi:predicted signal transduction protein with EAL and GGDEF domain
MDALRALGCTEVQGYLFSYPKAAKDIARLFQSRAKGRLIHFGPGRPGGSCAWPTMFDAK